MIALNVHDAMHRLVEGGCDLLMIVYHHPTLPLELDANRYEMASLGQEVVAPWVRPEAEGTPRYCLPGRTGRPLPYLGMHRALAWAASSINCSRTSRSPCTWTASTKPTWPRA